MPFKITSLLSKNRDYPLSLMNKKAHELFPRIWALGDLKILEKPLLGFFCSIKCPGDIILSSYDLARVLRDSGVAVIGGFHSPIEKDCLDLLHRGTQPIVVCPARGIENMRMRKEYEKSLDQGKLLFLSPFNKDQHRPTVKTSTDRNLLVAALSAVVFVAHAGPDSRTEDFCQEILSWKKPIYTFESGYNENLIKMGIQSMDIENISGFAKILSATDE
ncbi:MAG: DNA-processing protein DprA [Thermodesulfobacteriota bacterium]|nr:DNA-processing protein DprA [Thermodesulfobacteriota bacterium]